MEIMNEVPQSALDYWSDYNPKICTFTTPDERAVGIEPAVGLVTEPSHDADLGVQCVRVAWKPDKVDLAHLILGGTIWLSCWGGLPPHNLHVQAPTLNGDEPTKFPSE